MLLANIQNLLDILLDEIHAESSNDLSEDSIQKLRHFFPDNLLLAALDLIDRERVMRLKTQWGRSFYEVHGSTSAYTVQPDLPSHMPAYCSCPSFAFSVLLSEDQLMCKHLLAVKLAQRLNKCVERNITDEGIPSTQLVSNE
ncbi:hypothetical protein DFH11DRAFT_1849314 [Phellopilus nigrolimitatus]|nr:hypothetical protein DFH11DRAFT_1849314 [Phellopilus nigrolimitatus]